MGIVDLETERRASFEFDFFPFEIEDGDFFTDFFFAMERERYEDDSGTGKQRRSKRCRCRTEKVGTLNRRETEEVRVLTDGVRPTGGGDNDTNYRLKSALRSAHEQKIVDELCLFLKNVGFVIECFCIVLSKCLMILVLF